MLGEHSPCPHIPLLLPMSHPPSHLLSSSLPSPSQSKNRIGRLNQPRQLCQTDESEPPCCYTLHHSMSRDTKDWITPGNTVWSEFYLGFGSGSDVALAKPPRVQRESPSASSWILFWLQLSGFPGRAGAGGCSPVQAVLGGRGTAPTLVRPQCCHEGVLEQPGLIS